MGFASVCPEFAVSSYLCKLCALKMALLSTGRKKYRVKKAGFKAQGKAARHFQQEHAELILLKKDSGIHPKWKSREKSTEK